MQRIKSIHTESLCRANYYRTWMSAVFKLQERPGVSQLHMAADVELEAASPGRNVTPNAAVRL